VRGEDLLGDFYIRKLSFAQQQSNTGVLLWMVAAITIAGVLLSGFQLLAAYRLANNGRGEFSQGGELSFDSKSISLKSSVTGVVILTLSLAFFIAYVKWVYPIKIQMDPEVAATNSNFANAMVSNVPMTLTSGAPGPRPDPVHIRLRFRPTKDLDDRLKTTLAYAPERRPGPANLALATSPAPHRQSACLDRCGRGGARGSVK
jgi:hypothetical protein